MFDVSLHCKIATSPFGTHPGTPTIALRSLEIPHRIMIAAHQ
jgi:hypothetical protein